MIDGLPVGNFGFGGIVVVAVYMVFTDRLVTRKRLEDAQKEGAEWRRAHTTSEVVRLEQAGQLVALLELSKTMDAFIRAVPKGGPSA